MKDGVVGIGTTFTMPTYLTVTTFVDTFTKTKQLSSFSSYKQDLVSHIYLPFEDEPPSLSSFSGFFKS